MNKPTAFIVEDDRDLANIFAEALQAGGFDTYIIRSGDTALAQLATTVPDVIVLDLHLPHVSGVEILRQVRADARLAETRVIIATADPRMAESVEDQADLSLLKPISFSQLRDLAVRLSTSVQGE
jgi:DNA-binding response OmpR family regulator